MSRRLIPNRNDVMRLNRSLRHSESQYRWRWGPYHRRENPVPIRKESAWSPECLGGEKW